MNLMYSRTAWKILTAIVLGIGILYFVFGNNNTLSPTAKSGAANATPNVARFLAAVGQTRVSSKNVSTSNHLKGMTRTFNDEFNSFSRYVDKNGNATCGTDGSGTWQTVYYFCSRTIAANHEAEVYTDQSFLSYINSQSAISTTARNPFSINNGILTIAAAPSDAAIRSVIGPWAAYTSGLITTQFSFSQTYGYFEIRAKLPTGKGIWPAFWLLPIDKTWPPEVDAMEAFGDMSPTGEGGRTLIHYGSFSSRSGESCGEWYDIGVDITQDFHTYGVDIEPTGITYYFDEKPYANCPVNSDTNKPFYMLINLAVGSNLAWPGAPDASSPQSAYLNVDYVRAYKK